MSHYVLQAGGMEQLVTWNLVMEMSISAGVILAVSKFMLLYIPGLIFCFLDVSDKRSGQKFIICATFKSYGILLNTVLGSEIS